ncbi:hypothetical protein Tco_0271276 [Tanacetum coccineum]
MSAEVHQAAETVTTSNELDVLFGPLFDEYFNGENQVVLKSSAVTTTDASNKRQQQPDSTSSTSTLAITSKEEHEVHLKLVLESLMKGKLYDKFSKLSDALSIKEKVKSRRVKGMNLAAQSEVFKQENVLTERLHGLDQHMERKGDESLYFMDRI